MNFHESVGVRWLQYEHRLEAIGAFDSSKHVGLDGCVLRGTSYEVYLSCRLIVFEYDRLRQIVLVVLVRTVP